MGKTVLYIATSLDGFIADENGGVDWLNDYQGKGEDYGYGEFLKTLGAVIMGSKTYEQVLDFNHWYENVEGYVFTTRPLKKIDPTIQFMQGDPAPLVQKLREKEKDSWLVGGAQLVTHYINHNLLDTLIWTQVPKILGNGIPLFQQIEQASTLRLQTCKSYPDGVIQLTYLF